MKDDYLWDRSGQPDPDIQELEEILGELRYQPRPLEIPADLKTGGNRFYFPRYAIAAAVAMVVLSLGVWLAIQRQRTVDVTAGNAPESKPAEVKSINSDDSTKDGSETAAVGPIDEKKLSHLTAGNVTPVEQPRAPRVSVKANRSRRTVTTPQMTSAELAEAELAKERLMMAMRLASSKLNYAQKKTQGSGPATPLYHQHKIG